MKTKILMFACAMPSLLLAFCYSLTSTTALAGPKIDFASFFGGKNQEFGSVTADSQGNIILAGYTDSANFPTKNGIPNTNVLAYGLGEIFIAKFDSTMTQLQFSMHLGGKITNPGAVGVDSAGNIYVAGSTTSTNFPTVNAFRSQVAGASDAYLIKLSPDGSQILFSTLIGGSGSDSVSGLVVSTNGIVYLCGSSSSTDFPSVGSQIGSGPSQNSDAWIGKINTIQGTLDQCAKFGGTGIDSANSIALATDGSIVVAGTTLSTNFPVLNALQATGSGGQLGFVSKINPQTGQFVFSTYWGGNGPALILKTRLDSAQNIFVGGVFSATNFFASTGAVGSDRPGIPGAFVSKLTPTGSASSFTAVLAGSQSSGLGDFAVDSQGRVIVVGGTTATNFPTANPLQATYTRTPGASDPDVFISVLSPDASKLLFSTYYGGRQSIVNDSASTVVLSPAGNLIISGRTTDGTFPTVNAFQSLYGLDGNLSSTQGDAFVMQISGYADVQVPGPRLSVTKSGSSVILNWPSTATGFRLQSSSVLPASSWGDETVASTGAGGTFNFTNATAIGQGAKFYRLKQ